MPDEVPQLGKGSPGGGQVDFRDGTFNGPALGNGIQNIHYGAPRVRAAWPHQVGVIPPRAGCFQRRAETAGLRQSLTGEQAAVLLAQDTVRRQVLAGMGGVGKTQLAADYARTAWQAGELDLLVWITASNATAAASGYAQAGIEVLGADPDAAAGAFLAWLEPKPQQRPCRWLVVLDDVTDPADLTGLWPPASRYGRTLVTTRRRDAALIGHGRSLMEVGLFTEAEALAYLTSMLAGRDRHEPDDQLVALARDLGRLPLALSQAAAYLIDAGETTTAYRRLLADRTATLLDAAPDVLPDDQTHTTAAAWSLSIDRANTLRPVGLARPMLQLAAFLDANGIPETVLTSKPALAYLATHQAPTGQKPSDDRQNPVSVQHAVRALRILHRLHLIDHTPHHAARIHQLVQHAVRDTLTPDQHDRTARIAADALMAVWPDVERDTALAEALRSNTTALAKIAEDALYQPEPHWVMFYAGTSLGEAGQVSAARDHFQYLAGIITAHLGADHPNALATRHRLAQWQGRAGDAAGAVVALTDLLANRVRVLGHDHPDTLASRHDLAKWQGSAGDAAGAATTFASLLPQVVRVMGPDHPAVLTTRDNLAWWGGVSGDTTAATAFTEILADSVRILGPDHPETLRRRQHLAHWQGTAGNTLGAAATIAALLADQRRILGPDHPDTLTTRAALARWQAEAGDLAGAVAELAELLDHQERILGPDHPDTCDSRHNLARWRSEAGDVAGAAE
ncbi:tetratricopeptide repeat protein [Streptomyces fagopyri]|uniref:tetratricopeptide repeat protein n=1 Tax=Streptomyces fagopyri TaxID=2662397 RepID=UPI003716FA63